MLSQTKCIQKMFANVEVWIMSMEVWIIKIYSSNSHPVHKIFSSPGAKLLAVTVDAATADLLDICREITNAFQIKEITNWVECINTYETVIQPGSYQSADYLARKMKLLQNKDTQQIRNTS